MVTEWFIELLVSVVVWVEGVLPVPAVPDFFADIPGYSTTVGGYMEGVGAWLPLSLIATVVVAYLLCLTAGVLVKLARIVASFFTAGGGSAA